MTVLLDAAGTLIEVRGRVGEVYAEVARRAGAALDPERVETAFGRTMATAPPLAFGHLPEEERRAAERSWWRAVATAAVAGAGAPPALDPERFFDLAWNRFGGAAAWRVFPDARPALRALREAGRPLVVFSNWDGRLGRLLDELGLGGFFARILVSGRLPAAKPDPAAFAAVEAAIADLPGSGRPILVGDRIDHDVEPALAAGWGAVWLDRSGAGGSPPEGAARIEDLRQLPEVLAVVGAPA